MFCPECRAEYVGGISQCPDCEVSLVENLPNIIKNRTKSYLKLATLLIIIGISLNFALRFFGTVVPGFFGIFPVPFIANILLFMVGLAGIFFYTVFYHEYTLKKSKTLTNATGWAIAGAVAMIIVYFRNTAIEYNLYPPLTIQLKSLQALDAVIPWLTSITILIFAIAFLMETRNSDLSKLKKPALFFVLGTGAGLLWLTFVMFNFLISGWLFQYNKFLTLALISFPIVAFSFAATLYFYISFYKTEL